jgi:AcrR family transcriptional regulator
MARKKTARSTGQHHGDLKRSLLETATRLVESGNVEFSLRELARCAGVTAAAPYHHFESKAAVLDEVATAGFLGLEQALADAVASAPNPEQQLTQMVLGYLQFSSEHASHYQLMFPPGLGTDATRLPLRTVAEAAFMRLLHAVRTLRKDASEEDLFFWAFSVWALCHGFLTLKRDGLLDGGLPFGSFESIMPRIAALSSELVAKAPSKPIMPAATLRKV